MISIIYSYMSTMTTTQNPLQITLSIRFMPQYQTKKSTQKKAKENEKGNLKKKNKETPTVSNIFATSKFKIMGQKCKIIQCEQQREKPCQIIILQ